MNILGWIQIRMFWPHPAKSPDPTQSGFSKRSGPRSATLQKPSNKTKKTEILLVWWTVLWSRSRLEPDFLVAEIEKRLNTVSRLLIWIKFIPDPQHRFITQFSTVLRSGSGFHPDSIRFIDPDPYPNWESGSGSRGKKNTKNKNKKTYWYYFYTYWYGNC